MKKQVLTIVAMLLTAFGAAAQTFGVPTQNGQVVYFTINNGTAWVTYENSTNPRYTSLSGDLVLPDTVLYELTSYPVTRIGANSFNGCTGITSITIPHTIARIESGAFRGCTGLTTINFNADSCTNMSGVFQQCTNVVTLNIGANVKRIPSGAFNGCNGLTKTNFLGTVEQWLTMNITYNPIQLSQNLYINDVLLTNLVYPEGTTQINANFRYDTAITSVTIPASVTNIATNAFDDCTGLTKTNFLGTVAQWNSMTIGNSGSPILQSKNLYLNDVLLTDLVLPDTTHIKYNFSGDTAITSVTIPASVTNIVSNAFSGFTGLTTVNFNADSCVVMNSVFQNCSTLTTLNIGPNVKNIPSNAFSGTGLTTLTIPPSVKNIGGNAFQNCRSLTTVNHNADSCIVRSGRPFNGCTALATVNIGANVKYFSSYLFLGCTSLTKTNFLGTVQQWAAMSFQGNTPVQFSRNLYFNDVLLTDLVFPEGTTRVNNFAYDTALTSVTIPSTVDSIASYAFRSCTGLATLHYNADSAIVDGEFSPFANCTALDTVYFGANVRSLPAFLFRDLGSLPLITVPSTITAIGDNAFMNVRMIYYNGTATGSPWGALCVNGYYEDSLYYADSSKEVLTGAHYAIVNANVPTTVRRIGHNAFWSCTSLRNITLPATVDTIGDSAFYGCNYIDTISFAGSLAQWCNVHFANPYSNPARNTYYGYFFVDGNLLGDTIVIPDGVTSIGQYAFYTGRVASLSLPASLTAIGNGAFYNCASMTTVTIPQGVRTIGTDAFSNYAVLASVHFNADSCDAQYAFGGNSLRNIYIGDSVRYITANTFRYNGQNAGVDRWPISTLVLGRSLREVGDSAFSGRYVNNTIIMNADSMYRWGYHDWFYSNSSVALTIGEAVRLLPEVWLDSLNLSSITSLAMYALQVHDVDTVQSTIYANNKNNCRVKVPCEALQNYLSVAPWNEFRYVEIDQMCALMDSTPVSPYLKAYINEKLACVNDTLVIREGARLRLTAEHDYPVYGFGNFEIKRVPYKPIDTTFASGFRYNGGDDTFGPEVAIPFPFYFFNARKSSFRQGTNGMITFATNQFASGDTSCPAQYSIKPLPWRDNTDTTINIATMRDAIYGIYEDLDYNPALLSGQQGIYCSVIGNAPRRMLVCSWNGIPLQGCSDRRATYQIVCYEGTNIIEVHIKQRRACMAWQQGMGIVGVQSADGYGAVYPYEHTPTDEDWDSVAFRFTPSSQWSSSSDSITYRWLRLFDDGRPAVALGTTTGDTNGYFLASNPLEITAMPTLTSRYVFEALMWHDGVVNYTLRDTVVVKVRKWCTVSTATADSLYGETAGDCTVHEGDDAYVKAYAKMHCRFDGWSDGVLDNPRLVAVMGDTTLTALFTPCDTVYVTDSLAVVHDTTWVIDTVTIRDTINAKNIFEMQEVGVMSAEPMSYQKTGTTGNISTLFTNNTRTFIPDGPNCSWEPLYVSNVVSGFMDGALIMSPDDILSVCINMEHSYLGDLTLALVCPNGSRAVLKYKNSNSIPAGIQVPTGTYGGGGIFLGIPYGGNNHHSPYDGVNKCDSLDNPYGFGYDYCFSRNGNVTLVNGQPANTPFPEDAGLANAPTVTDTHVFQPIPAGFSNAGQSCDTAVATSVVPASNREELSGFYVPASDFTELVGCPLNGEWKIEVRDSVAVDNGWLFNWSIDFGNEVSAVSQDTTLGTVEGGGTSASGHGIQVTAMPNAGVYFVGWSDGSEENPYMIALSGDTTLIAYFAENDSIVLHDTINVVWIHDTLYRTDTIYIHDTMHVSITDVETLQAKIYQRNGQVVVEGAGGNMVTFYDVNGRVLATKQDNDMPLCFDVPVAGTYIIKIGNHPARKVVVIR